MYRIVNFIKKIIVLVIFTYPLGLLAQTDTEFWFVVPEITINHGTPGGRPAFLRFASTGLPATITVSQPATPGFTPIVINLAANASYNLDLSNFIALNIAGTWTDQNLLENKPLNPTGINNFGLYIKSTTPITAYYEINNTLNGEIWALKGKNALGTNFYTPFQQLTANGNYPGPPDATAQPYSAIDIVATEDGTTVIVTPTKNAGYGNAGFTIAANTPKTFILNKGQTLSIFPAGKNNAAAQNPANRLSGTHVTSDKPIAISLKDDSISHTFGTCKDALGDQLIPVSVAGVEYICNRTFLNNEDNIIVVATAAATPIYVDGVLKTTINAGGQYRISFPTTYPTIYMKIASRLLATDPYKPIIVYHIGGFGCEVGAAVIPPIDVCTGSSKVSFSRSNSTPFYLTMMVRDGAQGKFLVDGVVRNDIIDSTAFVLVPGTQWRVARFGRPPAPAPAPYGIPTALLPVGQHTVSNTRDIFHLGIFNGDASTTCWFGYFSDFNKFDPQSFVVETGGPGNLLCYGDSAQLYASGGTKYNWVPSDFLDDPFKDTPTARNVTKSVKYEVTVSGVCGLSATKEVNLIVAPYMDPRFTTDVFAGCAPLTVNIINNSTNVSLNYWDLNSDGDLTDPYEGLNNSATFPVVFDNTTADTIRYYITLLATDASSICWKEVTKSILVYPRINPSFTTTIPDPNHCHPLSVTFNNTSIGKTGAPTAENGLKYDWNFGDGGSSYDKSPTHVFNNFNIGPTTYNGSLLITDKYNKCTSTIPTSVTVQPYIKASFVVDKVESCSPFNLTVLNDSKGGVNNYFWDRDGNGTYEYSVPTATGWTLPYTNATTTNTPKNVTILLKVTNAGGCSDITSRTITIDPPVTINTFTNNYVAPGCSPFSVNFSATTTNATIYHWLMDGNSIDNQTTATYAFDNYTAAPTTKVVTFTASNVYGCSANQAYNVIVQPWVNADVALDKELGCSPLTVNFTNTSSLGASLFQWDIENDGSVDFTTKNITAQTFADPSTTLGVRTVPVKLTASNAAGCSSSTIKTITVNPQATAGFTYIDNGNPNHCSALNAGFTSSTIVTNTDTWQWEFGSYGASTSADPTFLFTNDGVADVNVPVTLKTNNSFGCFATTSQNIIVRPSVKALFSLDKTAGCPPYDATVAANTSAAIINYTWDFDGTPASGPNQVFSNPSNLTGLDVTKVIKLTVSSGFCSDVATKSIVVYPQVQALYTALPLLTGCSPLTVNFENKSALYGTGTPVNTIVWDFNDNSSSITPIISHTFTNPDNTLPKTFNVQLTATTDKGCTDSKTFPVTANPNVTAAFNASIIQPCTPVQIQVVNASFAGPTITTYNWNFNGGTPVVPPNNNNFTVDYTNPDPENPVNRTISLSLNNTFGCTSSTSQTFTIDPQVVAGLSIVAPATDRLCAPASFTFGNLSTGGSLSYTWDFNDGDVQTVYNRSNITHLFENRTAATKTFNVKITAANTKGCSNNATKTVYAYPEVDSKFSMTRDSACTPFYVRIKDESLNGTQWKWDFGHTILGVPQQRTSTVAGETFTQIIDNDILPEAIRNYKINLRLDDLTTGCWDTISQFINVYPRITSVFTVTPNSGCNPLTVNFTNTSTGLGNYLWEFDNGLSYNQNTPPANLVLTNSSTVNDKIISIKLTATNALGCKSASRKSVTVAPDVIASFTSSILEGCDPFTADFLNLTPSTAYDYSWTVNGVQESTSKDYLGRIFTNLTNPPVINTYNVTLKSSYKANATCFSSVSKIITVNPRVYPNFTLSNPVDCHPVITNITNSTVSYNNSATYSWNLGNGTYSTLMNLTNQQYKNSSATKDTTYNIKLIATSVHQCVDSITKTVTVHPRPIASYVMGNESLGCSPFPISLTNLSIGTNLDYQFNLGDGSPLINTNDRNLVVNYTYHNLTNDVQPYTISLRATTAFGCQNSTSQTIYAYPEVKANFSFNPGSAACSPFEVSLNNSTTNGYFYQWNFDDGTNSNLMSPTHRFVNVTENDKIFNIHLTSVSAYDCHDDIIIPLTVYATPVANFSVNPPLKIYPDATFNFHNQSNPAANGWTYTWTFGDGYTSSAKEAGDHTYATWGLKNNDYIYTSTLKVEAPHCSDFTTNVLRLLPAEPKPFFSADIYNSCSPLEAHFINASQYGSNYLWDFDDGTTSTVDEPIHTFTKPGYYNVKLRVFGDGGETFYYKTFRVYQNPTADFAVYPNRVMLPDAEVHIYNLTKNADRYEWDLGDGTLLNDKDPVHKYGELGEFRISLRAYAPDSLGSCTDFTSKFPAVWVEGIGKVVFPNAFMPSKTGSNGGLYDDIDYKNEVFHPVHYGVVEYKLMVFNRWGEQIFQSTDIKVGWDGYFQGKLCDQGVYIWRAIGKFTNGKIFDQKGNVTLLR